ncbi:hypothetical protein J4465_01385 [Candidatus Pacearchaeota archaeon]|nr:hypothetical protein [Candidatus Pacearchaeota archaeon]
MVNLLLQILIFAYASVGIIATIGYIPTIKDLWFHKKMSANISSYIIWTFCSAITFLYALLIISDLLLEIVTGLNFACCAIILILSILLVYRK